MRPYGCTAVGLCGLRAVRLYGCTAVRRYGCAAARLCVCGAAVARAAEAAAAAAATVALSGLPTCPPVLPGWLMLGAAYTNSFDVLSHSLPSPQEMEECGLHLSAPTVTIQSLDFDCC